MDFVKEACWISCCNNIFFPFGWEVARCQWYCRSLPGDSASTDLVLSGIFSADVLDDMNAIVFWGSSERRWYLIRLCQRSWICAWAECLIGIQSSVSMHFSFMFKIRISQNNMAVYQKIATSGDISRTFLQKKKTYKKKHKWIVGFSVLANI